MSKYKALITAGLAAVGGVFKFINNAQTRKGVACLRTAKMLVYWLAQYDLPQHKRKKNRNGRYCMAKIRHYAEQFKIREDRLTS